MPFDDCDLQVVNLVNQWQKDVYVLSSSTERRAHPNYQKLVDMGVDAVPALLWMSQQGSIDLLCVLHDITGANPVPDDCRGNLHKMRLLWWAWGKKHGYLPKGNNASAASSEGSSIE
jgi:hypothetical protein